MSQCEVLLYTLKILITFYRGAIIPCLAESCFCVVSLVSFTVVYIYKQIKTLIHKYQVVSIKGGFGLVGGLYKAGI